MVSVTESPPIGVGSESNFLESGSDVSELFSVMSIFVAGVLLIMFAALVSSLPKLAQGSTGVLVDR